MPRARPDGGADESAPRRAGLTSDPKQVVAQGYDAIADRYAAWAKEFETPATAWLERFLDLLPPRSDVLDLGCGRGTPFTRRLAALHRVTGVDLSGRQIALARAEVPEGTFICADVSTVDLPEAAFDGIVSLFMLGHVPRAEHAAVLRRMAGWLRPGGVALLTMGTSGGEEVDPDWLGAPMYFSSWPVERNRSLLQEAALEVLSERVIAHHEPGHGDVSFMWILARKPAA
jgi:SAM-dependent methyltransferase